MQLDDKADHIIHISSRPEQHCNAHRTIRQIIEMQQYPPKCSTVAEIRIRRYNARHNRQKALHLDSPTDRQRSAHDRMSTLNKPQRSYSGLT